MDFISYSVGQKLHPLATGEVLTTMNYRNNLWELVVGFPGIANEELYHLNHGDIELLFTLVSDCLFFCHKIGGLGWMDTPYEPRL